MTTYGFEAESQIYSRMLQGKTYEVPMTSDEWREVAREKLAPGPFGYVDGGAGSEESMHENRRAFQNWKVRPRMMRNVEDRDLSIELFGVRYPVPFLLAPIGVQSIIHAAAEHAPAKAAAQERIPFILSTVSSVSMEEIANDMGDAPRWFQLYPGRDPEIIKSFVSRAERAGYSAIVVTVDTTMLAWRPVDLRNAYLPFLQGEGIANFVTDPAFLSRLSKSPQDNPQAAVEEFLKVYVNPAFSWDDLKTIRDYTTLPLLVKGITHPDDAHMAFHVGADGVIVSNHGGRQVDGSIGALDALVEIRQAVGARRTVLMDSGIRTAADILKAMALGADGVLVGRPYAYALGANGQSGVEQWIFHMKAELDLQMALSGYALVSDLDGTYVSRGSL